MPPKKPQQRPSKLVCIPWLEVDITSPEAPEISHLTPMNAAESQKRKNAKTCWEKFIVNIKSIFGTPPPDVDEFQSICLRTETTMDEVRKMILAKEISAKSKKGPPMANSMSKYLALDSPIITINDMIAQMKEIILEVTFSRHYCVKDSNLADLVKGKTIVGLYVWIAGYCYYQTGSGDYRFWDRFSQIARQSLLLWADVIAILTTVEHLRDTGTHMARVMEKHSLEVPLSKEGRKFRIHKEEMNKMKNFSNLKKDMAWNLDLSHPRALRVLYSKRAGQILPRCKVAWLSFEMLDMASQFKYSHEILGYAEMLLVPIVPLLTKLKETTTQIDQTTRLDPNTETDVILGMIIFDKLDLLTLAGNTLKLYIKEIRTTIHVCYEFCRYFHEPPGFKKYEDIFTDIFKDIKHCDVNMEPCLTYHEASLKYNSDTYPDLLQRIPLYTTEFTMILQELKDVFDMDTLSTTNDNDM